MGPLGPTAEPGERAGPGDGGSPAVVTDVIDGDTLRVVLAHSADPTDESSDGNGAAAGGAADIQVRVRILGVDATELAAGGRPAQCYAMEASEHLARLVPVGTRVLLVPDPDKPDRDRYDRLLRHVDVDVDVDTDTDTATGAGTDVGHELLTAGSAYPTETRWPTSRSGPHLAAAASARDAGRGAWGACG